MSLLRISLRDFVIVTALELELNPGFTALTGETGAGKSILIDALQLALGARADAGVVREGQARAEVSAEFVTNPAARQWLQLEGLESDADTLLIRRTVDGQGKSRAWINGSPVPAAQLRALGECLVDIHGQHAWQSLMKPESCRCLLDEFGHIPVQRLWPLWRDWVNARERLEQAQAQQMDLDERKDRLLWQISEVERLAPQTGEWTVLQAEHQRLAHAHGLIEAAQQAIDRLSEQEPNVLEELSRCLDVLQPKQGIDPRFLPICQAIEQSEVVLREAVRDLQALTRHTDVDPERLAEVDQRMAQWLALAKRHRCDPEALPEQLAAWEHDLHALEALIDIDALHADVMRTQACYREVAEDISRQRALACETLGEQITDVIQRLGMEGGRFSVQLLPLQEPVAQGLEAVDFLVAGHAGVSPRSVGKVASGGELSRIALAIAVTTSQLGQCPTLIFDEVDSGVGGRVARTVGELMHTLGNTRQVLAVTHLPQVAAHANHHIRVSKSTTPSGTESRVVRLDPPARVAEIARMLGGTSDSEASMAHAREMLRS
jgi:DNA repair protein RecN (Recombination protein N)